MHRLLQFFLMLATALAGAPLTAQLSFATDLENYSARLLPEKLYVHTDKNIYAGGENIYAAVYLLNGISHQPDSLSKTIYLELVSSEGKMVKRLRLFAGQGHSAASILIPANIQPGDYRITAYTNYQRNGYSGGLFRKLIRIVSGLKESGGVGYDEPVLTTDTFTSGGPDRAVDLRFFPESGDCAANIPCRVAVVSTLKNGSPISFTGNLEGPQNGESPIMVTTNDRGIGTFTYLPDETSVVVKASQGGQTYPLPQPKGKGTHIRVDVGKDTVDITMHSNDPVYGLNGHTFILHLRGAGLLEQGFTSKKPRFKIRLPTKLIPAGVVVATLLDSEGNPVAERLFFIPPDDTEIKVTPNAETYSLRAPVQLAFSVPQSDLADSLNLARLSISVLPEASTGGPTGDDIRTWLLINSDVDHPVQQAPELIYGAGTLAEKARQIDEFLLTRAWRRFRWEKLPALNEAEPQHLLERGLYIRGRMTKMDNPEAARPGKVFLTRMANAFNDETMTDAEGYFTLGPYFTTDTFPVLLLGRFKPGKKNRLAQDVSIEDRRTAKLNILPYDGVDWAALPPLKQMPLLKKTDYEEVSRKTLTVARTYDSLIVDLQTVDVTASRIDAAEEEREARTNKLYSAPTRRIVIADNVYAQTTPLVLDVLDKLNGVRRFTDSEGEIFFNIRGAETPDGGPIPAAVFLDGLQVRIGRLAALQMAQVEFIDVLTVQRAVALGPNAEGGAIMIYRYADGRGRPEEPGAKETILTGYHTVREFASFNPSLPENRNRPDYRTTLFWAPLLQSDERGKTSTRFTTSDQKGTFRIFVQGLRNDGTPLFGEGSFEVND